MASPHLMKYYTPFLNEMLAAMVRKKLNGTQSALVLTIIRFTYGYSAGKGSRKRCTAVEMSYVEIAAWAELEYRLVVKEMGRLVQRNILIKVPGRHTTATNTWHVSTDYDQWLTSDPSDTSDATDSSDRLYSSHSDHLDTTASDHSDTSRSDQSSTLLKKGGKKTVKESVVDVDDADHFVWNRGAGQILDDTDDDPCSRDDWWPVASPGSHIEQDESVALSSARTDLDNEGDRRQDGWQHSPVPDATAGRPSLHPLYEPLRDMGLTARQAGTIIERHPDYPLHELERWKKWLKRPVAQNLKHPAGYLYNELLEGRRAEAMPGDTPVVYGPRRVPTIEELQAEFDRRQRLLAENSIDAPRRS